jgi:hypothetical protein
MSVQPSAQQAHGIGNVIARLHHPPPADPLHRSGILSAFFLGRRLLPYEFTRRLEGTAVETPIWPHLKNIAADPWATSRFAAHSLRYRYLARRKYPSVTVVPADGIFTLDVHAEQLPNWHSRITLATAQDRFGVPRLRVDWRYQPADIRSVVVTLGLLRDALSAGCHGVLAFDAAAVESVLRHEGAYGGHHLGTARMSDSPHTGVVDANCRVHSVENLYVAGGAVFATSGQANPTLTILSLALRLADHLTLCLADPGWPRRLAQSARVLPV